MARTKDWIQAMRLRTLPLSLSGIILGSAVALYNDLFNGFIFWFAILTTVLFQITSNLANDLGDGMKGTDNNERVGPTRAIQSGKIAIKSMKIGIAITIILSIISSGILIYLSAKTLTQNLVIFYFVLACLSIIAAVTYTIGKRAYGYHGLGDIMVFVFFGLVSVLGVYSLYSSTFLLENILLSCFVGLLSTAVLNLNNMRDYKNDSNSGKTTLVVKMGPNNAKLYHAIIVFTSLLCFATFIFKMNNPILFLSLIPGLYLIYHLRIVMMISDPKEFDPELKKVALCTFAMCTLFLALISFNH